MNRHLICWSLFLFLSTLTGCNKKDETPAPKDIWDIDKNGIPRFVTTNYIELDKICRISKFRSSVGHDYSDMTEQCRSMKHYFEPKAETDWSAIKVYAPVKGVITRVEQEWAGTKLEIASDLYPAFRFSIFHISMASPFVVDDVVEEGQYLGTHAGSMTYSDISVIVNDPTRQGRMVSYFLVITDAVFEQYTSRGVLTRDALIISKELRDAHPLTCNGDTFLPGDPLDGWVMLN